jgi:hypothetical protein
MRGEVGWRGIGDFMLVIRETASKFQLLTRLLMLEGFVMNTAPNAAIVARRDKALLSAGICRWAGRIIGTLLVAVVVAIAIGEGMPNLLTQSGIVQLGFAALGLLLLGILIGWRWELAGGCLSLVGWCLFYVQMISPSRPNWLLWALAIPGILYITSYLSARYASRRSNV